MLKTLLFTVSAFASALICGFSLITLAAASLTLCAICWFKELMMVVRPSWYVVNDPESYNPLLISRALEKGVAEASGSSTALLLHISNPGVNTIRIEMIAGGEVKVSDSRRSIAVENCGGWIPDHPLPLILKAGERSTLSFRPLPDQRLCVSTSPPPLSRRARTCLFIPPLLLLAIFSLDAAAAALIAALLHTVLDQRFGES